MCNSSYNNIYRNVLDLIEFTDIGLKNHTLEFKQNLFNELYHANLAKFITVYFCHKIALKVSSL